ncbi:hypothetical protein M5689_003268 [Euphorbia peplus]|nr:hypothetical protein M5689_003268 [Euphorbia peplus]
MPIFSISNEAILRHAVAEIGSAPSRFEYECTEPGMHKCRLYYTFPDIHTQEQPFYICGALAATKADSKKRTYYRTLKALQSLIGLIVVDYNYGRLQTSQTEYMSNLDALMRNIFVPNA